MDERLAAVLDKAKKLAELARRASTAGEAQAAARALAALLARHRLDVAELEASTTEPRVGYACERAPVGLRDAVWRQFLLTAIAEVHGVVVLRTTDGRGRKERRLAGRPDDLTLVRYFYAWVVAAAARLGSGEPKRSRASWYLAFALGVRRQLLGAQEEARAGTSSTALAVIDRRCEDVLTVLRRRHGHVSTRKVTIGREEPADLGAHLRGYHAGRHLPIDTADGKRSLS